MNIQNTQLQVRIDLKTKKQTQKILDDLGLDLSTAVKMFCRQIIKTKTLPLNLHSPYQFNPKKAQILRSAIHEAKHTTQKPVFDIEQIPCMK
ncbi:MAG: type II toxin-antitoxin system RelB/DinJ family antitoxin [Candidatus Magasanikbacteria bacterium]|nr:type II toxin-antitoxin system RelB/DinJ family antitoxin [Candidatus Magasanikbacteria bacterium]